MSNAVIPDGKIIYPKSEIKKCYCPPKSLDVDNIKGVYKSFDIINRDRAQGTLKINKTMAYVGGRLFFLCEKGSSP